MRSIAGVNLRNYFLLHNNMTMYRYAISASKMLTQHCAHNVCYVDNKTFRKIVPPTPQWAGRPRGDNLTTFGPHWPRAKWGRKRRQCVASDIGQSTVRGGRYARDVRLTALCH